MSEGATDRVARVRALLQACQPLPRDLAEWVEQQLSARVHAAGVRGQRDAYLRQAASIAGGTLGNQVRAILAEAKVLERCWARYQLMTPEPGTVRGAVHRARLLQAIPRRRRLYEILQAVHSAASQLHESH